MRNVENAIKNHNTKIVENPNKEKDKNACNVRNKTECKKQRLQRKCHLRGKN